MKIRTCFKWKIGLNWKYGAQLSSSFWTVVLATPLPIQLHIVTTLPWESIERQKNAWSSERGEKLPLFGRTPSAHFKLAFLRFF